MTERATHAHASHRGERMAATPRGARTRASHRAAHAVAALAAWCVALMLFARPAAAYFDDVATGARGISMGDASIALVSDASAYYWNPAALADTRRPELLIDYARPYAVPDLSASAIAGSARRFGTGWGLAWHHYGIANVYSEDQFCLSAARTVLESRTGHHVLAGATFKLGRMAFQPFDVPAGTIDLGSQTKGSLDAGLKWVTPWKFDFSGVLRDINQPRYQFVDNTGGDLQRARLQLGAAIRWNRESTIAMGWSQDKYGVGSLSAGVEVLFFDVFAVRSGISNISRIYQDYGRPTEIGYNGGFGLLHKGYTLDAAAAASHDLGASYRVSLRVPFGAGVTP